MLGAGLCLIHRLSLYLSPVVQCQTVSAEKEQAMLPCQEKHDTSAGSPRQAKNELC